MASEQARQLEAGIRALEAQRGVLGDAVVDTSVAGLRAQLAALGAAGDANAADDQALKHVTILFLDVVGSTTLSQHLDPEGISAVLDDALKRATHVVEAHRGRVLQYAGDSILAAFGADEVREDDVERSVHCGLALLDLGHALAAEIEAAHGRSGFDVRVGLHTGAVLLGGEVDGSIRGVAVHIAARMEQTAPPGGLRISHDTYAAVRGLFEVDAQEPLAVKGIDAPIRSYLVRGAKPRTFRVANRGIEGVATRMIGRDAELAALQDAFARTLAERRLATLLVVADAGVGKSRLLHEFEAWTQTQAPSLLLRGRATPQTGSQAFGLLRDVFAWRCRIADDDSLEVARAKIERGVIPVFEPDGRDVAEAHAHLLGHLIGIDWRESRHLRGILDDAQQIRNRALHAAAQLLRRIGAAGPVVLQLEDLHWADRESLDFLRYLVEVAGDVPLLVLASTRPTLFEQHGDALAAADGRAGVAQRIDLAPLGANASALLVDELLKQLPEVPGVLRELLTTSAAGNPFYMEELVKMLIDQGAITTGPTWAVELERLMLTRVPATLTGVLQARLDGLPTAEKRALQHASVVGAVFWDQALAAVDDDAAAQLPALTRRELTVPRADAEPDGLREYAFCHQVLHQVTYDTVLKRARREGHAKVARWLARLTEQGSLRAGDLLGAAAEHFERAGERAHAAEFHARAADRAGQRFAHERVLDHVARALALVGESGDGRSAADAAALRWRLLCRREQTLDLQARRDEQAADLAALVTLADALGDDRRRAEVALRRSIRAARMGDWAATEAAAREATTFAATAGDDAQRVNALRQLAAARVMQRDLVAGRALAQQGLGEARRLGMRGAEARLLNVLAVADDLQGDRVGLLELGRQSLAIYRETGDRVNEGVGLTNLGVALLGVGAHAEAERELDAALQLLRANGDRVIEGAALTTLSMAALWQGDAARASALARSSLEIAVATRARHKEVISLLRLGDAEAALGRASAARDAYAQALQLAAESGDAQQHDARAGLAQVALAEGDVDAALTALQPVLEHTAAGGTLDGTDARHLELTCHQVLARAGDARAAQWLERAHAALVAQADAIADPVLRRGFLHDIPAHGAIMETFAGGAARAP
jgi:class 3 adenylate cyclase/tetratricopeptide (TPR) repeat protein